MTESWCPSRSGRPIDLVHPVAAEVDWPDLAHAMARLNRYGGNSETPVSVGLHTLIALEAAPLAARAHVLLHDAHETRTGELMSPTKEAYRAVATELFDPQAADIIDRVRDELEARHDRAVHEAAGLALPGEFERRAIRAADLVALATERRDFLHPAARARRWLIDDMGVTPLPRVFRFKPPDIVADLLLAAFRQHLPALARRANHRPPAA